jgi:hypothetical protein
MEEGFRQEWEELEAERLQLSDWEHRLGDHIQVVATRNTEERAQLERERDVLHEKMRRTIDQEAAVAQREKVVVQREKAAVQKDLEVEEKLQTARRTIDYVKAAAKMIDEERADLQQRELSVVEERACLAARLVDLETRAQDLREQEVVFQENEAKVEGLLAEQSAGIE